MQTYRAGMGGELMRVRLLAKRTTFTTTCAVMFLAGRLAGAQDLESTPGTQVQAIDGAVLFAEHCAHCHSTNVIEPGIAGLARLDADYVYRTLWSGIMREAANGLDDAERRAIAQFVGAINPVKRKAFLGDTCAPGTGSEFATSWQSWAPQEQNTRHVGALELGAAQLRRATLKWAFVLPDTGSTSNAGSQVTIAAGRVFLGTRSGYVISLDAASGCTHWAIKPVAGVRSAISVRDDLAIFADYENHVYAVDANTGAMRWQRKADEQPSARVNGSVTVSGNTVLVPVSTNQEFVNALDPELPCCSFRGSLTAFELHSGTRLWQAKTIEQPLLKIGTNAAGVPRYGPSGGGLWSVPTVDRERGLVYVGSSNQKTGPPVPESDAVLAFDLRTGDKKWVRNLAPPRYGNDIWNGGCVGVLTDPQEECPDENETGEGDRDIGAPIVITSLPDGNDALIAATKDGMVYALDPDRTGAIIWQTRVGAVMRVRGPSFGGVEHGIATDGRSIYVPISDVDVLENESFGAMVALDLASGAITWRTEALEASCDGRPARCHNSISTPPTIAGDVVFAGATDGMLRAYGRESGEVVWEFDTTNSFVGVNGAEGHGGSIIRGGTAVVDGMFFQTSGYGQGLGMPGNVLFAFEYPDE